MDYIEGVSLAQVLAEEGAQKQENVIKWAKQLTDTLGYLHSRKPSIIYRDMKPSNIMLKPDGNITLIDFGTAREYEEKKLEDTTYLGTVGYAAPEQFGGQGQTDARTDIYNLGVTLYHLVTNHNPSEPPYVIRPIREINASLSPGLEMIIAKCTQSNPEDRYQTAAELMYALENYETIDSKYRSSQKTKLASFIGVSLAAVVAGSGSLLAYNGMLASRGDLYQNYVASASDQTITARESADMYLEAIALDPTREEAYLDLVDLFLDYDINSTDAKGRSENVDDVLSIEESAVITNLEAGLSVEENNSTTVIFPLEQLASSNYDAYQDVAFEIANAYWYEYELLNARTSVGSEWFSRAQEKYPISEVYVRIGGLRNDIQRYRSQNRTEMMYDSYEALWASQESLYEFAEEMDDNDTRMLVWPEIINNIDSETVYFVETIDHEDIYELISSIEESAIELSEGSPLNEVKTQVSDLLVQIDDTRSKLDVAVRQRS